MLSTIWLYSFLLPNCLNLLSNLSDIHNKYSLYCEVQLRIFFSYFYFYYQIFLVTLEQFKITKFLLNHRINFNNPNIVELIPSFIHIVHDDTRHNCYTSTSLNMHSETMWHEHWSYFIPSDSSPADTTWTWQVHKFKPWRGAQGCYTMNWADDYKLKLLHLGTLKFVAKWLKKYGVGTIKR
jgi:hypothetical protein